jgi:hypothetical protein
MKNKKTILITIFASLFAVLTVVNMSMASPKSAGENTLDMLEIMTRAFDESEGGEGGTGTKYDKDYCECHKDGVKSWDFSSFMGMTWECVIGTTLDACEDHPGCSTGSSCPTE